MNQIFPQSSAKTSTGNDVGVGIGYAANSLVASVTRPIEFAARAANQMYFPPVSARMVNGVSNDNGADESPIFCFHLRRLIFFA